MSNKILVYTSNLDVNPRNMGEVIEFAQSKPKFYISPVGFSSTLANVEEGDNLITKKGNSLYVLRAIKNDLDNLSADESKYLNEIKARYGAKNVNITGVDHVIKFAEWCKSAKPFINNFKEEKKMTKNSIKSISARLKEMFTPTEAKDVRIATDGNICVATSNGYVAIDANNSLVAYPEELTLEVPVYVMPKPATQLAVGDVIALERSYAKVTKIEGEKITAIGYTGAGKTIHTIKDFLFNQTMVRVVVSLAGNLGGQINPLMLLALSGDDKKDSLLPLLMMNQNGGALQANPMLMLALAGKGEGESSLKDLLLMSAMGGGVNPFACFTQPAAPATNATGAAEEAAE
jgi:hypothetical protein